MSHVQESSTASPTSDKDKTGRAVASKVLKNLTDTVGGIPSLRVLGNAALRLVDLKDYVQSNKDETDALIDRVTKTTKDILEPTHGLDASSLDEALTRDVTELELAVTSIQSFVETLTKLPTRVARSPGISFEIQKHHACLDAALSRFDTVSLWSLRVADIRRAQGQCSTTQEAGTAASLISSDLPMSYLPPRPDIFLGREDLVESVTATLITHPSPRIAILGPGGMGKTALALSVLHDARVEKKYGRHRMFISCEGTTSVADVISIFAATLKLNGQPDIRQIINHHFRLLGCSALLLLDNLESAWDSVDQLQVEEFLTDLASIPNLSLMITMRGVQRPDGPKWTRPSLDELGPLSLPAARHLYLKISDTSIEDNNLDDLLRILECWPLAVKLMASLGQMGSSPSSLLRRYEQEHTAMLKRHGGHRSRLTSLDISIQVSLDSQTMQQDPQAVRLLTLLSLLPDGIMWEQLPFLFPSMVMCQQAATTLQAASLAIRDGGDVLRVLSPVRAHMFSHYRVPVGAYWEELKAYHMHLAACGDEIGGNSTRSAIIELTCQFGNIQSILLHSVLTEDLTELMGKAILSFWRFSYLTSFRNCDKLLSTALSQVELRENMKELQGKLGEALGNSLHLQYHYDEASTTLRQAKEKFEEIGNHLGAAQCTQSLGNILGMQNRYDKASTTLRQAKEKFEEIGNHLGAAQCTQSLGDILGMQNRYDEASTTLRQAKEKFKEIGNCLGAAQCTWSLGDILRMQNRYDEASTKLRQANEKFEEIGDRFGAAQCTQSLGDILRMQNHYDEASTTLRQAKEKFEEIGDRLGAAKCTQSMGNILGMQKCYEEASTTLRQAKEKFEEIGDCLGAAQCEDILQAHQAEQLEKSKGASKRTKAKHFLRGLVKRGGKK